ncbi:serine hydrolase [Sphingomonas sp. RS2018]
MIALSLTTATPANLAQTPPVAATAPAASTELRARADDLLAVLKGGGDYDALFADTFRAQVPKPAFDAVRAQVVAGAGQPLAVAAVTASAPFAGSIDIRYERATASFVIALDAAAPHRIIGLRLVGVSTAEATLPAIDAALAALPGTTGLLLTRLGGPKPEPLVARNADRQFAIGSEFKLVILATLVRDLAAGRRRLEDMVTLDGAMRPAGGWSTAAKGTQVSLRDLAAKMISVSGNSATDILLDTLGRREVEGMMTTVGIAAPARSRPFLSTGELFKLKAVPALADKYLAADDAGRRALLAGDIARTPLIVATGLFADGKPVRIDSLEWFFSPMDVARTLDWIRRNTEAGPAADIRKILSINPALPPATAAKWRYIGYKGGSEPGVMAMSWPLQAQDGGWYALSGSWNDPAKPVDETRFAALMQRAADLAAAR